jgi:hypothetical protein
MRRNGRCLGVGLGLLLLMGPRVSWAQGPAIDHKAVGCVVADKFAGLEARFNPAENVSRARIYFRAEGGQFWYFVDMKAQGGAFQGVTLGAARRGFTATRAEQTPVEPISEAAASEFGWARRLQGFHVARRPRGF